MKKFDIFLRDKATTGIILISAIPQAIRRYRMLYEVDPSALSQMEEYLLSDLDYVTAEE